VVGETLERIPVTATGELVQIGGFGIRYLAGAETTGGAYALVEHSLVPGVIGAPPHRHTREDELSYVLSGTLTVWRAGAVTTAGPGTAVAKPRGEWHTFWNAGAEPVRFLELISPPRFANYFRELAALMPPAGPPDLAAIGALAERYGLEFDFRALGPLLGEHGLRLGGGSGLSALGGEGAAISDQR
jgi:mannose-6-phosphate isomerase-like protein (cupin superfamily)